MLLCITKVVFAIPFKDNETQRKYKREWYQKNKEKSITSVKKRKNETSSWLSDLKSSLKCSICSEDHPACLHFHHRDPNEKDIQIAQAANMGWSKEKILAEIAKCDVLCANCHAKLHYEQNQKNKDCT
jgi:hypothetical protein